MKYYDNVLELIGHTPMVKLNQLCDENSATLLAKLEYLNPGGSVKDRMAICMIRGAEERGIIKPGATLIESTSGNTGMGLAMAAAVLGYHCVFTIPDKMSKEKIDMLKAYGAEVLVTPTDLAHDHPDSYVGVALRMAREIPNSLYVDQYSNMDNPKAHYLTTGPEIWEDTEGKIDCLVGGIGTGGTVSGAGKYLKEKAAEAGKEFQIICPDPHGSIYFDMHQGRKPGPPSIYRVEGIGHDFMVDTLDFSVIDEILPISDRDSFLTARRLVREEGIFAGGSAGTAVFGAMEVAKRLGPGKVVVVIIPDSGDRYISKCFDDEWMKDTGYLGLDERIGCVRDLLRYKGGEVVFARPDETLASVVQRMSDMGISQMPVAIDDGHSHKMIHELDLLRTLASGKCKGDDTVMKAATTLEGKVSLDEPLSKVQHVFDDDHVAIAMDNDKIIGIITKIDLVEFLASRT